MSITKTVGKAQLPKIIQLCGFVGTFVSKLAGLLLEFGSLLTKSVLAPLAGMASVSAIDGATLRKMRGREAILTSCGGVVRAWKQIQWKYCWCF